MKKVILLLTILGFMVAGCNENKKEDKAIAGPSKDSLNSTKETVKAVQQPMDLTKSASVSPEDVEKMAAHYQELVMKNPAAGFQQITMDGEILQALLFGTEGFKLVAGADLKTNTITMFLQFWKKGIFTYKDISTYFNSTEKGMRGQAPVCPPPAGCDLPLPKSVNPQVLSETDVMQMAAHYNELVLKDPGSCIRQITMDGLLLELLLYKTEGLKLIAAADMKTNEITVIMQFWKDGEFTYYDIRELFTSGMKGMRGQAPVCPPPAGCDLPIIPLK